MEYVYRILIGLFTFVTAASAQSFDDTQYRKSASDRILRTHSVFFDPSTSSLTDLLDAEARLGTAARIKRSHGVTIPYNSASLTDLIDMESRLSASSRLRKLGIEADYRQYSVSDMLDMEGRVSTANRIYKRFSVGLDWKTISTSDLLDAECRIGASERIKNRFGVATDWKNSTSSQLLNFEIALAQQQQQARTNTVPPAASYGQSVAPTTPLTAGEAGVPPSIFIPGVETPTVTFKPKLESTPSYYNPAYRPLVGDHFVSGYVRSDGTYIPGHYRTNSDDSFWNNWSSYGNVNPYTGRVGKETPGSSAVGSTYVNGHFRSNGSYVRGHYRNK